MAHQSDLINWEDAMQQVGDDEEFLRELLGDLRTELDTQLRNISSIIQNPQDSPYERIRQAAHFIKGAAGNLMCGPLRMASLELEQAAAAANGSPTPENIALVQTHVTGFQQAAANFLGFLVAIGV